MILTSDSGKRMMGYIPPIYEQSYVLQAIFQANGLQIDDLHTWINDIQAQLFPQTATWGLQYWEQRVGLPVNSDIPIETRRQKVISKLSTRTPVTPARMRMIVEAISGVSVVIEENIAPYTFRVVLVSAGEKDINLSDTISTVKNVKPAHLSFEILIEARATITIGIGVEHFRFQYDMAGTGNTGTIPDINIAGTVPAGVINYDADAQSYTLSYPMCGTKKAGQ